MMVDGQYATPRFISTTLSNGLLGSPLNRENTYVQFDLGSRARRQISIYARSSLGLCAMAIGPQDTLEAWDRSDAPVMHGMADSYAGTFSRNWPGGGIFLEAAMRLGIPHVDISGIGGTGYAPNSVFTNTGDAFGARIAEMTRARSDLFITAGSINDNNWLAFPPYVSGEAARAGFEAATLKYFSDLRAALPGAVLAALGPWQPNPLRYPESARHKADAILAGLLAAGGNWVFIDNLQGSWVNSAGARSAVSSGPWQTGTGTVADPRGDGNADLYVSGDGTHPTEAGAEYLGIQLAQFLRQAVLAL